MAILNNSKDPNAKMPQFLRAIAGKSVAWWITILEVSLPLCEYLTSRGGQNEDPWYPRSYGLVLVLDPHLMVLKDHSCFEIKDLSLQDNKDHMWSLGLAAHTLSAHCTINLAYISFIFLKKRLSGDWLVKTKFIKIFLFSTYFHIITLGVWQASWK